MVPSPWRIQDTYGKNKENPLFSEAFLGIIKIQFGTVGLNNFLSLNSNYPDKLKIMWIITDSQEIDGALTLAHPGYL